MNTTIPTPFRSEAIPSDAEFSRFASVCATPRDASAPLVWQVREAEALWGFYLRAFPVEDRQHHNCRTCRQFITSAGATVTLTEEGNVQSAFWGHPDDTSYYGKVAKAMRDALARMTPERPFVATRGWGSPTTCQKHNWGHWFARPTTAWMRTNDSYAGDVEQGVGVVNQALAETRAKTLALAMDLIATGRIPRSEKVTPLVEALNALANHKTERRDNAVRYWLGRVTNLCHVRGSVAMTLLQDLQTSSDVDAVVARFREKVDPLAYMRPKALPSEQTVARAEKAFIEGGYQNSLLRRWARVEEIPCFWKRTYDEAPPERSVFKNVRVKDEAPPARKSVSSEPRRMSWSVFQRDILPTAANIDMQTTDRRTPVVFFTQAADPSAPSIIKEDKTISHYCWQNGSFASEANLRPGVWVRVVGLTQTWKHTYALLEGSRERNPDLGHTGLFPEVLKPEMHPFRAVIEEYNRNNRLPLPTDADGTIAGFSVVDNARLRVTTASGLVSEYIIDRAE